MSGQLVMAIEILLLTALVFFDAFFSLSETAFLLLSRITIRQMLNQKAKHAALIQKLKNSMDRVLTSVLVGTNIVVSASSAIATALAISLIGNAGVGIATGIMTCVIIVFGEIIPKTGAARNPSGTAQKIAPFLNFFMTLAMPLTFAFNAYTALLNRVMRKTLAASPLVTEEELKTLIEVGRDEGALEDAEKKMLLNVFEFTDLRVSSASRHRSLVKAVALCASYDQMISAFIKSGYSRLPVFDGDEHNYIGVIHYKDALFARADKSEGFMKKMLRKIRFIPGTMSCGALLEVFKTERINFAAVVDEHGGNTGIITMEDILNAVLGKLYDEYDYSENTPVERITIVSETEFLVPGEIKLSDFNQIFSESFCSEYYDTLAGWLLEQFDALPQDGDIIKRGKYLFEIENQMRRRIYTVRIKKTVA
jgi:putative hemolysin